MFQFHFVNLAIFYFDCFIFKACDESCESTCSDGTNKGCDSCKDGYTQNEDQACVGKYSIRLINISY